MQEFNKETKNGMEINQLRLKNPLIAIKKCDEAC